MTKENQDIAHNLRTILDKVAAAYNSSDPDKRAPQMPRLVAVSKTKPKELIYEAYAAGQRHFGENYIQELNEKANDPELREKCPDIKWHFIGNCQTNKANKVVQSPNISVVETVSTTKLLDKLQSQCKSADKTVGVMVQVNTSGEENKNGLEPRDVNGLVKTIIEKCPNLKFIGLMTIGALGHSLASSRKDDEIGPNPDFLLLLECRKKLAEELNIKMEEIELSMGMSNDFEEAIGMGSTNVRVGSSIFGARDYNKKDQNEIVEKLADTSIAGK